MKVCQSCDEELAVIFDGQEELDTCQKCSGIIEGWLGGHYDDLGIHETEESAGRGFGGELLDDLLMEYQEKKVRITVEVIE